MKKLILFLILFVSLISVSACQKNDASSDKQNSEEIENSQNTILKEIKATNSTKNDDGLNLIKTLEFNYGESEGSLEMYTSADIDELGNPLLDDGNNFLILVTMGEKVYPIFENQYVQLGIPEVSAYYDTDKDELHIILIDARTASYDVIDFVWDEQKKVFMQHDVLKYVGGNYLGKLS